MEKTITVEENQLEKIESLIKVTNKIEKKLNNTLTTIRVNEKTTKEKNIYIYGTDEHYTVPVKVANITININTDTIDNVKEKFIIYAKIEHIENMHNRVKVFNEKIFDMYSLEELKALEPKCEHCNTNRYRKYTYLLYDMHKKKIIQIARTCMKKYTLIENIERYLDYLEVISQFGEIKEFNDETMTKEGWYNYYGNSVAYYNKLEVVTIIKEIINKYGYASKQQGYKKSTYERVMEELRQRKNIIVDSTVADDIREFLEYDKKKYYKNYRREDDNFIFSLEKILSYDFIQRKDAGILCCFYNSLEYIRNKVKEIEEINSITKDNSNIEIQEGKRIELKGLIVDNNRTYNNDYGFGTTTTYYYFKDKNNTYLWKSSRIFDELQIGKIINIKGTVKSIEADKIILTRCKLI